MSFSKIYRFMILAVLNLNLISCHQSKIPEQGLQTFIDVVPDSELPELNSRKDGRSEEAQNKKEKKDPSLDSKKDLVENPSINSLNKKINYKIPEIFVYNAGLDLVDDSPLMRKRLVEIKACIIDPKTNTPVQNGYFLITRFDQSQIKVVTDFWGCFKWSEEILFNKYSIQRRIIKSVIIENLDKTFSEMIRLAIVPWVDNGWIFGRDVRYLPKKLLEQSGFVRPRLILHEYKLESLDWNYRVDSLLKMAVARDFALMLKPVILRHDDLMGGAEVSERLVDGWWYLRLLIRSHSQNPQPSNYIHHWEQLVWVHDGIINTQLQLSINDLVRMATINEIVFELEAVDQKSIPFNLLIDKSYNYFSQQKAHPVWELDPAQNGSLSDKLKFERGISFNEAQKICEAKNHSEKCQIEQINMLENAPVGGSFALFENIQQRSLYNYQEPIKGVMSSRENITDFIKKSLNLFQDEWSKSRSIYNLDEFRKLFGLELIFLDQDDSQWRSRGENNQLNKRDDFLFHNPSIGKDEINQFIDHLSSQLYRHQDPFLYVQESSLNKNSQRIDQQICKYLVNYLYQKYNSPHLSSYINKAKYKRVLDFHIEEGVAICGNRPFDLFNFELKRHIVDDGQDHFKLHSAQLKAGSQTNYTLSYGSQQSKNKSFTKSWKYDFGAQFSGGIFPKGIADFVIGPFSEYIPKIISSLTYGKSMSEDSSNSKGRNLVHSINLQFEKVNLTYSLPPHRRCLLVTPSVRPQDSYWIQIFEKLIGKLKGSKEIDLFNEMINFGLYFCQSIQSVPYETTESYYFISQNLNTNNSHLIFTNDIRNRPLSIYLRGEKELARFLMLFSEVEMNGKSVDIMTDKELISEAKELFNRVHRSQIYSKIQTYPGVMDEYGVMEEKLIGGDVKSSSHFISDLWRGFGLLMTQ